MPCGLYRPGPPEAKPLYSSGGRGARLPGRPRAKEKRGLARTRAASKKGPKPRVEKAARTQRNRRLLKQTFRLAREKALDQVGLLDAPLAREALGREALLQLRDLEAAE